MTSCAHTCNTGVSCVPGIHSFTAQCCTPIYTSIDCISLVVVPVVVLVPVMVPVVVPACCCLRRTLSFFYTRHPLVLFQDCRRVRTHNSTGILRSTNIQYTWWTGRVIFHQLHSTMTTVDYLVNGISLVCMLAVDFVWSLRHRLSFLP